MRDVCVIVRNGFFLLLSSPGALHPPDFFAPAPSSTSAFSLGLIPLRLTLGATPTLIGSSAPPLPPLTAAQRAQSPHLQSPHYIVCGA